MKTAPALSDEEYITGLIAASIRVLERGRVLKKFPPKRQKKLSNIRILLRDNLCSIWQMRKPILEGQNLGEDDFGDIRVGLRSLPPPIERLHLKCPLRTIAPLPRESQPSASTAAREQYLTWNES